MPITWEALTAVASLISSVAVLGAVLVAVRQLRVGAAQVEHLQRATQLEGTMKIFAMLSSAEQQAARRFIALELGERMKDPAFRAEVSLLTLSGWTDEHQEIPVLRLMEMIGTYVKHGLLDSVIVFDYWIPVLTATWERLDELGIIAAHRQALGPEMWENFEDLYARGQRWLQNAPPVAALRAVPRPTPQKEVVADAPGT